MTGPAPTDLVWVSILRRGITMHALDLYTTVCGRSMRTGLHRTAAEIEQLQATPCPRCWPREETTA